MDTARSAAVVLSAAGTTGTSDMPARAAEVVGADMVLEAASAIADPWLAAGGEILTPGDPDWPHGLADLHDSEPCALWLRGRLTSDPRGMTAIVGSRRCTPYGVRTAAALAAKLSPERRVVSGGARGIDAAAHTGALAAGGATVLLAAGGAGRIYPPEHRDLFVRAAAHGAVVWEYPPAAPMSKASFLHRNRLIAAMSQATVLVEAAERSGALNTGRTAADLGRLVLAVPGHIDDVSSAGVHRAVADGWAALLLGAEDLREVLGEPAARV